MRDSISGLKQALYAVRCRGKEFDVTDEIDWEGQSGKKYRYWIYPIGQSFKSVPGNYIFAKETSPNTWRPIYIGQTSDLSERFDNHHAMPCVRQNGGTHIHVHQNGAGEQARRAEEADLIAHWKPDCNG